jgi:hypothetical protein
VTTNYTGLRVGRPQLAVGPNRRAANTRTTTTASTGRRTDQIVAWLILIGLLIPASDAYFYLANAKLTVGRIGIIILLIPALVKLLQKGRRIVFCDLIVCALAGWMVLAALHTSGLAALGSAGAESLEFAGGYLVARAFVFGPVALNTFIRTLKLLTFIAVILGVPEFIWGQLFVHEFFRSIFHFPTFVAPQVRIVMGATFVRVMSSFDHSILFGAFCALVATITLYSEPKVIKRLFLFGVFCLGILVSLSSSALMAIQIAIAIYIYDNLLGRYHWRWSLLWTTTTIFLLMIILLTNHPLGWLISHFTLNPESGYFRYLIWMEAIPNIKASPLTGHAFQSLGGILDTTVDSVWLVFALRYGIPTVVLLFLANLAAFAPRMRSPGEGARGSEIKRMSTAFSLVLILFMFMGLTVHYWNYIWIFWGVCLGIRASLREASMSVASGLTSFSHERPLRRRSAF